MATPTEGVTVLHRCSVAPPNAAADAKEQILPLTFLDIIWLYLHPIQRIVFYHHSCSTTHFLETIVPNLKKSLSQTLRHYLPLAGHLYHPMDPNPGLPELRYAAGDSVPVTFSVCSGGFDFSYLTGDHPRNAAAFHSFVPALPEPRIDGESGFQVIPVLAIQVTFFPETGICLGFSNHHIIGDASSIVGFIKAWSFISRLGNLPENHLLPFYDRSVIKDPTGRANLHWNQTKQIKFGSFNYELPTNKIRATFILQKSEIQELRNQVLARAPSGSLHLSSFAITTSYVWSCLVKSAAPSGEQVDDDEPEYFGFAVEGRHRMDPPLPAAYFGNCLAFNVVESRHGILKRDDGFFAAVMIVADAIANKVNNTAELWRDADEWLVKYAPLATKRVLGVSGSPRFDLYETDFGWGKPIKYEVISIDLGVTSMSLCKSRQFDGGLEIGMSLPEKKMEAFAAAFSAGK